MAGVSSYNSLTDLNGYLQGTISSSDAELEAYATRMLSTSTNGIEGIPYQFLDTVDRRVSNTNVGRKYAEKIFAKMPLLFLTPCEPLFMDDFNNGQSGIANALIGNIHPSDALSMLSAKDWSQKKYYSAEFAYDSYYGILNPMLASVAYYLGIANEYIPFNGGQRQIKNINWEEELNSSFKQFFSPGENLVFYLDGLNNVSETFQNNTTDSSLAGMINGLSEQVNELRFLFGKNGNLTSSLMSAAGEASETIGSGLSSIAEGLAGGVIGSVTENIPAFMDGAKIVFPKIWGDSSFDRSYSLEFKLRSPDHDSVSLFLNVIKPYCKLLALAMPREFRSKDPNLYTSPFLVRAAAKGMFNIDMGMITSLSISKGAECCWNVDGLPTQIDISITIEDLYSSLHSSGYSDLWHPLRDAKAMVENTAYQDYLANMAGLNIAQMEVGRKALMYTYLVGNRIGSEGSMMMNKLNTGVSRAIYNLYKRI